MKLLSNSVILAVWSSSHARAAAAVSGSYWALYPDGNATTDCDKEDGVMVDASCCENASFKTSPIADMYNGTCFVIEGLLGTPGPSLMSYLGCNGDKPTYGEACYNGGENGGLIPYNATIDFDSDAESSDMCGESGCQFIVQGNGCQVIRDFSSLPGFENDVRQVFLYMDEYCTDGDAGDSDDTSSVVPHFRSMKSLGVRMLAGALFYALQ